MAVYECPREVDVVDAVTTGRWPARCEAELMDHVASCGPCADIAATLGTILEDAERLQTDAPVPPSSVVWWRARLRARDAAIRDAVRPIAVAQMAGLLCLGALIGAVAVLAAPWFAAISASGREVLEAGAGMLAASAQLTSGWLPLVAGLAASLLLAPLALYFALARD